MLKAAISNMMNDADPFSEPVDFVVTWVDGNDPDWIDEKNKYDNQANVKGNGAERYRDWDQFMYWFRSVEKYAPWVRKVFLITWGHIPKWLNTASDKLVVVTHNSYIPYKYLPTFSSIPIELNIFRISELSEYFVYFNDDTYLARPTALEDFFVNGLPKYCGVAYPVKNYGYNGPFAHQLFSNIGITNSKFNVQRCIEDHPDLWFSSVYAEDKKYNWRAYEDSYISGMYFSHLPCPYRKSTLKKVWEEIPTIMNDVSLHKFRTPLDVNHQVFSIWEIMNGTFVPVDKMYYGKKLGILSNQIEIIEREFTNQKSLCICLNDSIDVTEENFEFLKEKTDAILRKVFPDKSSFER